MSISTVSTTNMLKDNRTVPSTYNPFIISSITPTLPSYSLVTFPSTSAINISSKSDLIENVIGTPRTKFTIPETITTIPIGRHSKKTIIIIENMI